MVLSKKKYRKRPSPGGLQPGDSSPKDCTFFQNNGFWDSNFTKWTLEAEEYQIQSLKNFFTDPDETNDVHREGLQHFLFCGDSTVIRLFSQIFYSAALSSQSFVTIKTSNRCDLMEYYGFKRAKNWISPNLSIEGPCRYGHDNPYCTDCRGCNSMFKVSYEDGKIQQTYEYISIEFARDREFQTDKSSTSQETLGLYLQKTFRRDLCVATAGIHDVILDISVMQFAENVSDYLTILTRWCKKVVWLQTTASLDTPSRKQKNEILMRFNAAVKRTCSQDHLDQIMIFNTWEMSLPAELHADNVHHTGIYYKEVVRLILELAGTK